MRTAILALGLVASALTILGGLIVALGSGLATPDSEQYITFLKHGGWTMLLGLVGLFLALLSRAHPRIAGLGMIAIAIVTGGLAGGFVIVPVILYLVAAVLALFGARQPPPPPPPRITGALER